MARTLKGKDLKVGMRVDTDAGVGKVVSIREDGAACVRLDRMYHGDYDWAVPYNDECEVLNSAVNSTRPIVQMALNRTACNANIDSLVREINKHGELAAQKEGANIYIDVLTKVGNEPIGEFIERKVGRGVWKMLKPVNLDDAGNCATFAVVNSSAPAGVVENGRDNTICQYIDKARQEIKAALDYMNTQYCFLDDSQKNEVRRLLLQARSVLDDAWKRSH